jgi:hypothetical protein
MGLNAIKSVLENSKAIGTDRLVLTILAYHQNDETGECFPSHDLLCQEVGIKKRGLVYCLNRLEALKEIQIIRGLGKGNNSKYRITLDGQKVHDHAPLQDDQKVHPTVQRVHGGAPLQVGQKVHGTVEKVHGAVSKGAWDGIAYKEEQKEQKEQKETPFENLGIGEALEDTFPGHATNIKLMFELHSLCEKLQATAEDVRRFPDWLKKTYPMKAISPFALKDLLAESLKSRPVVKIPDPTLCPTCRGRKVVLKHGMAKFQGGTPMMPCPDCTDVATNAAEKTNVINSNRFAIA